MTITFFLFESLKLNTIIRNQVFLKEKTFKSDDTSIESRPKLVFRRIFAGYEKTRAYKCFDRQTNNSLK